MNASVSKYSVAIVTFDSYIELYSETLRWIAWKLQSNECHVIRVGCEGRLQACTSINSLGADKHSEEKRQSVCFVCKKAQSKISTNIIANIARENNANEKASDFLCNVESMLKQGKPISAVLNLCYEGFPLCKIAFFDFSIVLKVSQELVLNEDQIIRFINGVRDLTIILGHLNELQKKNHFTHIIYINGNYSQNTLVRMFFDKNKATCLSVEPQLTSQHSLNKIFLKEGRMKLSSEGLYSANPASATKPANLSSVLKNFGARVSGSDFNTYTSLVEINNKSEMQNLLDFLDAYNRVHSFFLSSEDELIPHVVTHEFANNLNTECPIYFENQFELFKFFVSEAEKHTDIGFVVRLHPRMAKNKREAFESNEHVRYKNLINEMRLPRNIRIILGDSKISSYYLIHRSDLVIISWSTIGLEALMMGKPVVSAFPSHLMYPLDKFSLQPQNSKELSAALFTSSEYGKIDDIKLFNWVSHAYEDQFFSTLAPRGRGGLLGRLYRLLYKIIDRIGLYNAFAYLMDLTYLRDSQFTDKHLLERKVGDAKSISVKSMTKAISSYRLKIRDHLYAYHKKYLKNT